MKKVLSVVIILIVIMLGSYIFTLQSDNTKENNTTNNETVETNKTKNEISTNKVENEVIEENANEVVENNIENTISSETFEEEPETAEEKAINIVKKDWKEDDKAQFSVEGIDGNGNYIVTVRDNKTTEALAFYNVNIKSETFTKKEMN